MFELIRTTPMPEYNGQSDFYVHDATGMEVFHIKNTDSEMSCCFMFSTPSEDSTGVAHILEHTVLCGSKRFPVKDPFSQVLLTSPNTFLNAMTFCDKTIYPFASPLKKDFDILFDIYADAVFAPLLRKQSFLQEGIRNFDGKFDGVVFNEMCGARSTEDSILQSNITRDLYRGTPYEHDSGGDPLYIVDLTYEQYLERYRKWYSPTNCRLYLFGDIDAPKYLDRLEKLYLKDCPRGEKIIPKSEYYMQNNMKGVRSRVSCPSKDASSVVKTWLTTPSDDPLEILTASVLVEILLGNPGAPLYKAIIESGLGEDLSPISGVEVDSPVLSFTVGFSHAKENAEDEIEEFLQNQFRRFVQEGLDEDLVQSAIKRQEFKIQEIPGGGTPFGILTCIRCARSWMRGTSPEEAVMSISRLEKLKARIAQGRYFESWMERNILNNSRTCLLTVVSDDSYEESQKATLQGKMDALVKSGLIGSDEDKALFEAFVNTEDSPEALATIPRITIKDLPRRIAKYDQDLIRLESGAKLYDFRLFTRGIVYLTALFDTRGLDYEEKRLLPLLVRTMQMCGTSEHDYSQLGVLIKTYTGSFSMYPNAGVDVRKRPVSNVTMKAKVLSGDMKPALDLISEIILKGDLSDESRLKASLTDMITEFESGFSYSASAFASVHCASVFSATSLEYELSMGASLWLYLSDLRKALENGSESYSTLSGRLVALRDKIFVQRAMTVQVGSDCKDESHVGLVKEFVNSFPIGKYVKVSDFYKDFTARTAAGSIEKPVAIKLPSGPSFNALAVKYGKISEKDYNALSLLSSILTNGYLWKVVRGCNGAYGVECHTDNMEDILFFSSYRDPNIGETYKVFVDSLSQEVSMQEVEYAIVTVIGKEIRPNSPSSKCSAALRRVVFGNSVTRYLRNRRILLDLKPEDLRRVSGLVLSLLGKNCSATTVCSEAAAQGLETENTIALPI